MNREEHILTIIGEECSEVQQRCSKALRFGMDEKQHDQELTNSERILQEFNDLVAVMEMQFGPISMLVDRTAIDAKKTRVTRYLEYSKHECDTLQ